MKKSLRLKKVTLRNLDDSITSQVAAGAPTIPPGFCLTVLCPPRPTFVCMLDQH